MISTSRKAALAALGAGLLLSACAKIYIPEPPAPPPAEKDYSRELPAGRAALRKITGTARVPDFGAAYDADRGDLLAALNFSIGWFANPSSADAFPVQGITQPRAAASLVAFRELLTTSRSRSEFNAALVKGFDVYESVGCDEEGTVLFTGYYTPICEASVTPTAEYCWPLYRMPPDLVKDAKGDGMRKMPDGTLAPYYTRAEIEKGALKGQELVYLKDRFQAFICTIQGSAQLRLPDKTLFKVGYKANNGRKHTSVGLKLVAAGLLPKSDLSLMNLIAFFKQHPEKMDEYLPLDERYIFFQKTETAPVGCLNVPVTARCSIATDKSLFPRACLAFVDAQVPHLTPAGDMVQERWRHFALDQDSGGAIRAAGRADIYLGIGDDAGRIAGWTLSEGRLYYLFLKE